MNGIPHYLQRSISAGALAMVVIGSPGELPSQARETGRAPLPKGVERVKERAGISQHRLASNGMEILLVPSDAAPVVTFLIVVGVGSRNEAPGSTGSAHLLEHLLFNKSTENFGKESPGGRTIQEVLYEAGGDFSTSNMTTWYDRITMYDTLPADQLETTMRINADRLRRGRILDSERKTEMTVVRNEYERGENSPAQALYKAVVAAAVVAHPYHWSTIGYRSDIESVPTEKLREHYDTYFWPDNATAVLVGSFNPGEALRLFAEQFGGFSRSPRPLPKVTTVEPPQEGERRVVVRRAGAVPLVSLAWLRPGASAADYPASDVLATILGDGIASRLHQSLVETRLATSVSAWNWPMRDPFLLILNASLPEGADPARAEEEIRKVVGTIREAGVSDEELARAKAQIEAQTAFQREGTYGTAWTLGEAIAASGWEWWVDYLGAIRAVSREQVQALGRKYLGPDQVTVGWFVPRKPEGGEGASPKAEAQPAVEPDSTAAAASADPRADEGSPADSTVADTRERVLARKGEPTAEVGSSALDRAVDTLGPSTRSSAGAEGEAGGRPVSEGVAASEARGASRGEPKSEDGVKAEATADSGSVSRRNEATKPRAGEEATPAHGESGAREPLEGQADEMEPHLGEAAAAGAAAGAAERIRQGSPRGEGMGEDDRVGRTDDGTQALGDQTARAGGAGEASPAVRPSARGRSFEERTVRRVLDSGAVLLLLPSTLSDTVSIRIRVRAGRYLDGDKPGLAEATAEMLGRGTRQRTKLEIARALESAGSSRSWSVDAYDVLGSAECLSRHLKDLLATLVEELRTPRFAEEELAKLKEEMKAEILEDDNNTTRRAFEALSARIYPANHPLRGRPAQERLAALEALAPEALKAFHKARYGGAGLVIAIVGNFDPREVETELRRLLAGLPRGMLVPVEAARVTSHPSGRVVVSMKDKASVDIVIGAAGGLRRLDPDYEAAILANAVLGQSGLSSRLGKQVRDTEGLTYTIVSRFFSPFLLDGPWGIYLSVAPPNVERGIESSLAVLKSFLAEGISPRELAMEKSAAAGRFLVSLANNSGIADALAQAEAHGLGVSILDTYPDRIRAVTLEEANRALEAHIKAAGLLTIIAGSVAE